MKNKEDYMIEKWMPLSVKKFPKTIYVEGLHDDYEGFRVVVKSENPSKVFCIKFDSYYLGYRNFNESERLKSLPLFPENSREWCLFKSTKSKFIEWVVNESQGVQSGEKITHYFIVTSDDIIEILCLKEPVIEEL